MKSMSKMNYRALWLLAIALTVPALGAAQSDGSKNLASKDLKQAIAAAKTADDHLQIAQFYKEDAVRLDGEAKEHAGMAEAYRKTPTYDEQKHPMSGRTAGHCQWLADKYAEMAKRERELSKIHEDMAKSVTK